MVGARTFDAPDKLVPTVDSLLERDQVPVDARVARVRWAADHLLFFGVKRDLLPVLAQAPGVVPLVTFGHIAL